MDGDGKFQPGQSHGITNSTKNEVRYQHRGYGKYAEIANLFGWDALNDFWRSVNIDYINGIIYNRNNDEADSRILRMSRTAGADLRPLIHFWGVHPNNDNSLKAAMESEGLMPSALIYERLLHYQTLIPMNNAEFVAHADIVYPERDGTGDPDYGKGWYSVWEELYNESHGSAAQAAYRKLSIITSPMAGQVFSESSANISPLVIELGSKPLVELMAKITELFTSMVQKSEFLSFEFDNISYSDVK